MIALSNGPEAVSSASYRAKLKSLLKTLILMTEVHLYLLSLLKLQNCIIFPCLKSLHEAIFLEIWENEAT